jgi:hypothetical protein
VVHERVCKLRRDRLSRDQHPVVDGTHELVDRALVAADDSTHATLADYLEYVRDPANGYVSVAFPVEDGMEISSWTDR